MNKMERNIYRLLLVIYLAMLVWIVLFHGTLETLNVMFSPEFRSVNLYPYYNGAESWLNVAIFIPIGLYIELLSSGTRRKKFLMIALVTLTLEVIQYIFAVGTSDIMDVINNFLGGAIGIYIGVGAKIWLKEKAYKLLLIPAIAGTVLSAGIIGLAA